MSAGRVRGACLAYPPSKMRFRSRVQARAGLSRARGRLTAQGVPEALMPVHIERCRTCNGWHHHQDRAAVAAYLEEMSPTRQLLDLTAA